MQTCVREQTAKPLGLYMEQIDNAIPARGKARPFTLTITIWVSSLERRGRTSCIRKCFANPAIVGARFLH